MSEIDITKPIMVRDSDGDVFPARFLATDLVGGNGPWAVAVMVLEGREYVWIFDEAGSNSVYTIANVPEPICPEGYKEAWVGIGNDNILGSLFFKNKKIAEERLESKNIVSVFIPRHAKYDK